MSPSRRALRERFDESFHPPPQRPPLTHHREWYLATDGSMIDGRGRLGAVLESADGRTRGRWSRSFPARDNNAAEVAALHFGLDRAAVHLGMGDRLGILLDHDPLADAAAVCATPETSAPPRPPCGSASVNHWGGITARIAGVPDVRIGLVDSVDNPAHPVAHGPPG